MPGAQTLVASDYEVIISDDGPTNEAKSLIETNYIWANWVVGPKRGPAANRNNGAKLAAGKWLIFTDDDCLPDPNWLKAYLDAIAQHPGCMAFEGAILPDDWKLLKKDMAECPVNDKGGCFWSANIMVEKNLFWEVGGFDEQFKIAAQEDQDLYLRLAGITNVQFVANAKIIHPVRIASFAKKFRQIPRGINNWFILSTKHGSKWVACKKGFHSQMNAFLKNMVGFKLRSAVLNISSMVILPFLALKMKKGIHA